MSIAPWWCGIIIATKSASASPDDLTSMAAIILAFAAWLSSAYGAFLEQAAKDMAALMTATGNSAARGLPAARRRGPHPQARLGTGPPEMSGRGARTSY